MIQATKQLGKVDSSLLAEYILMKCGGLSHLKLQKLLYYVQALHLAYFGSEVIEDEFEAWLHGPVSRKIYNQLKDKSILYAVVQYTPDKDQPTPNENLRNALLPEQIELIDEVITEYAQLTSSQLEALSHSEQPWINARRGYDMTERCDAEISKEEMKEFYKKQVFPNG